MKTKKSKGLKTNKKFAAFGLVLLATVLIYGVSAYTLKLWPFPGSSLSSDTSSDSSQEQQTIDNDGKKDLIEEDQGTKGGNTDTEAGTTTKSIEISTQQESNNTVTVFTKLHGFSDGTCTLLINNGHQTSKTASVIFQPEYSICAGYTLSIAEIGPGPWILNLSVKSGDETISKQATVEIK